MSGEEGVPVWGIEVGGRVIKAARVSRRAEGGFWLLEYREEPAPSPGPEGAVEFLRRRNLLRHPVVLAVDSASSRFRTVALTAAEAAVENPHTALIEYVHPEPEEIELHSTPLAPAFHLLLAEDRARIEGYMIALERADLPAYGLCAALSALYEVVRRTGLFEGDGVVIRVGTGWSDLLFLDGPSVRHLALPLGRDDLARDDGRRAFATDFSRLLEYHRTRVPRDEGERIVLLGIDGPDAEALASHLPARPLPFPGDAGPLRGKGKITLLRAMELIRVSPVAIGAAIAGAASPRRLELAYHDLPAELPAPPRPAAAWLGAAAVVWLAVLIALLGVRRENTRLDAALAGSASAPARVAPRDVRAVEDLAASARRRISYSRAISRLAYLLPGKDSAPWRTDSIALTAGPAGGFRGLLSLRIAGGAAPDGSARGEKAVLRAEREGAEPVRKEADRDDLLIRAPFTGEERR